jgi:D-3-phosphoglycerate dehydrogenase
MTNKSRGNVAYTIVDLTGEISEETKQEIAAIDGMIRSRYI